MYVYDKITGIKLPIKCLHPLKGCLIDIETSIKKYGLSVEKFRNEFYDDFTDEEDINWYNSVSRICEFDKKAYFDPVRVWAFLVVWCKKEKAAK